MKYLFSHRVLTVSLGILALALLPIEAQTQGRLRLSHRPMRHAWTGEDVFVRSYSDSLRTFADSLFHKEIKVTGQLTNLDVAPVFLPLTFYKDISRKAFSLDSRLSPTDSLLLNMYLRRPDLVRNTQNQLEKAGPTLAPATVTERPTVIVKQATPIEPESQPVDVVVLKPNFWTINGDYFLQFLQNYISGNWYKGGESNYSMVGALTLEANYNNKQKLRWDNKLEMKLGFQTSRSDSLHKLKTSSDLLRYTGKLGLQATKRWYYTFQLLAYTQFMRNYKANQRSVLSDFASPANVNVSLGMDYSASWLKNRLTGTIHLAPLAYNLKYVGRLSLSKRYGLDEGRHTMHDLGSQLTLDMKWKFADNMLWQTRLYSYTTYERSELEWENTFTFQFNRYISTKLFVYPRFDDDTNRDDHHGYWQFKEYISLGFSYSF